MRCKLRVFDTMNGYRQFNCYAFIIPVIPEQPLDFGRITDGVELDLDSEIIKLAIEHGVRVVIQDWEEGEQVILTVIDTPHITPHK